MVRKKVTPEIAAARGVPVVRSSRVDEGIVDRNVEVDDDALGLVAARALGPAKARMLLMMLMLLLLLLMLFFVDFSPVLGLTQKKADFSPGI